VIVETDVHKLLTTGYIFKKVFTKYGLLIMIPFVLVVLLGAFWLWMLIDCIRRDFKDKAIWIVLLLFLNCTAAIVYYFLVKRIEDLDES